MNKPVDGAEALAREVLADGSIIPTEAITRFWTKVDKRGPDECWPWPGSKLKKDGRGTFSVRNRNMTAPNFSLRINRSCPPEGKTFACHSCDNPNCVNPSHLWWGSNADNIQDAAKKGLLTQQKKTHCPRGHPYSGDNLDITHIGGRRCVICLKAAKNAYFVRRDAKRAEARTALETRNG